MLFRQRLWDFFSVKTSVLSSLHNYFVLPLGQPSAVAVLPFPCTKEVGKGKLRWDCLFPPSISLPFPPSLWTNPRCRWHFLCYWSSTAARSGVLPGAGVLTSLSLHSSGRGRSYLRALIYDQGFGFVLFFFFKFVFLFDCFWSFFISVGAWKKSHPWSSCSWEFKQTDVVTIVCNKEICDISFNVLHIFPVRDFLLIFHWF